MVSGYILGISCGYHDSAATLVKDGQVIAACEEERFTGIKHDSSFPHNTLNWFFDKFNISKDNTCQHVQKGVTMSSSSSRFQLIEDELPSSVDDIFSNDSSFDPYSNFQ